MFDFAGILIMLRSGALLFTMEAVKETQTDLILKKIANALVLQHFCNQMFVNCPKKQGPAAIILKGKRVLVHCIYMGGVRG